MQLRYMLIGAMMLFLLHAMDSCNVGQDDPAAPKPSTGTSLTVRDDTFSQVQGDSTLINFLANDSFPESASLSVGQPQHGSLSPTGQELQFLWKSDPDFQGTDSVIYRLCFENRCREGRVDLQVHPSEPADTSSEDSCATSPCPGDSTQKDTCCPEFQVRTDTVVLPPQGQKVIPSGQLLANDSACPGDSLDWETLTIDVNTDQNEVVDIREKEFSINLSKDRPNQTFEKKSYTICGQQGCCKKGTVVFQYLN